MKEKSTLIQKVSDTMKQRNKIMEMKEADILFVQIQILENLKKKIILLQLENKQIKEEIEELKNEKKFSPAKLQRWQMLLVLLFKLFNSTLKRMFHYSLILFNLKTIMRLKLNPFSFV